jgi:hypothetical protein
MMTLTELLNWFWQAWRAAFVLAPWRQCAYAVNCGPSTPNAMSISPLNPSPSTPSTIPATAPRGRGAPPRRAWRSAVTPSHSATAPNTKVIASTYTARERFPISEIPSRLSTPSMSAAHARWRTSGAGVTGLAMASSRVAA